MTLEKAIEEANKRSTNINLNYYVHEWNDGDYIISTTSFVKKHNIKYVYGTGDINKEWLVTIDKKDNQRKHLVRLLSK